MKIIRYSSLAEIPWKNGAGVRRELIAGEASGTQDRAPYCQWSIGLAELIQDAPFSPYPAVSRWFLPLGAGRLTLLFKSGTEDRPVHLNGASPNVHFSGNDEVHMFLHDGPMKALNVMTTGTPPEVTMERIQLNPGPSLSWPCLGDIANLLLLVSGQCWIKNEHGSERLSLLDCAVLESDEQSDYQLRADEICELVKVSLIRK